jgi:hypothetical protein
MEWTRRAASPATSSASSKTHLAALGEPLASPWRVFSVSRRAFPSWNRSILNEIYLCHACSYQGILRTETPESGLFWLFVPNVLDFRMPQRSKQELMLRDPPHGVCKELLRPVLFAAVVYGACSLLDALQ